MESVLCYNCYRDATQILSYKLVLWTKPISFQSKTIPKSQFLKTVMSIQPKPISDSQISGLAQSQIPSFASQSSISMAIDATSKFQNPDLRPIHLRTSTQAKVKGHDGLAELMVAGSISSAEHMAMFPPTRLRTICKLGSCLIESVFEKP
ncbi:hypothetical protein FNV43_RR06565 [Rhamnella rubrinervis]|uniref:Uncharacterized protein n=1 Tax=Rhamnella rubrinervis TaxID=2594499 RepID=A0A8K0HD71_9ROSA|nr:hypothetical protein FNV43_RR06565 [Rhamnella rubrinervis]